MAGKIYESMVPNRGLYGLHVTSNGKTVHIPHVKIKFVKDGDTVNAENPVGFGIIVSDSPLLLKATQAKQSDIEANIEAEPDFKTRIPGKRGIWLRSERIAVQGKATCTNFRAELVRQGPAALRQLIQDNGGKVPASATVEELANLAFQALANPTVAGAKPAVVEAE